MPDDLQVQSVPEEELGSGVAPAYAALRALLMSMDHLGIDQNDDPWATYQTLRDDSPVWRDPITGFFVVSRYEDIRTIILDPKRFKSEVALERAIETDDEQKSAELATFAAVEAETFQLYEQKGWVPAPHVNVTDEPKHMQKRKVFDYAFRPANVAKLDSFIEEFATSLIDGFIDDGQCDFVAQYAVPLPLYVIGRQVGVKVEDLPKIKDWTETYVLRHGRCSTEERIRSTEAEIEAQHYLHPIFERLRREPDDTLLSIIVNEEVPAWGRRLNDNELLGSVWVDLLVGGSETTTGALALAAKMLAEDPELFGRISSNLDDLLDPFIEEVLRVQSPVQTHMRQAVVDVELQGVAIPAGSPILLLLGAANRDERRFACPAQVDLGRERPRSHLAFGTGTHACLGAALARRELHFGLKALLERVDRLWRTEGAEPVTYRASNFFRAPTALPLSFTKRSVAT